MTSRNKCTLLVFILVTEHETCDIMKVSMYSIHFKRDLFSCIVQRRLKKCILTYLQL